MNKFIKLGIAVLILYTLSGCSYFKKKHPHRYTSSPISAENYNEEKVTLTAKKLGMRPVDYLHYANNPDATHPSFQIFNIHFIPEGTAREQLSALDQFQDKPCLSPPCKCGRGGFGWRGFKGRLKCLPFIGAKEAGNHQERLEKIVKIQSMSLGMNTQ